MSVTACPPKGIEQSSAWPYTSLPDKPLSDGPWLLAMDAGGQMVLFEGDEDFHERGRGMLHVYSATREELEKVLVHFCKLGYETDENHIHQGGAVYIFNWRCGTLAQIMIAAQVIEKFLRGDVDGAWAAARAFEDQINAAQNAAADAGMTS